MNCVSYKLNARGKAVTTRQRKRRSNFSAKHRPEVQALEARLLLAADPLISEFQAMNASTINDVDGDFSDWIEIHNPDVEAMNLEGWYITDDAENLTKWRFPAGATIEPSGHSVVFASGKNLTDPAAALHTNFKLASDGEFLALVKPDGVTPVQTFDPYPGQAEDNSYGLAPGRNVTPLIDDESPVRALVPTDDSLGNDWTQIGFNDAQWQAGTNGVGYEVLNQGFSDRDEFAGAELAPRWVVDNPGSATVTATNGSLVMNVPTGLSTESDDRGAAPMVLTDPPVFADGLDTIPGEWEVITQVTQGESDRGSAGIVIYDGSSNVPVVKVRYSSRSTFEIRVNDDRKESDRDSGEEDYFLRLIRNNPARTWSASYKLLAEDAWINIGSVTDGVDDVPVILNPRPGLFAESGSSTMNATFHFFEFNVRDEAGTYGPQTGLDVSESLNGANSSIYTRLPFTVDGDPSQFDGLDLSLRFDDGYRAFLNGELVSEENAPRPPAPPAPNILPWNATAQGTHGASAGRIPVTAVDLDAFKANLRSGDNVLAIHGMNVAADDRDFFLSADLFGSEFVSSKAQLFVNPTPGQANLVPAPDAPIIMGNEGMFFGSTSVELELVEPRQGLEIRFTLDGSVPDQASRLYDGPIILTESAMLQARVFDGSEVPSLDPSPMAAATFIAVDPQIREMTSDIPIILVDTLEERLIPDASNSLTASNVVAIEVSKATGRASIADPKVDYVGRGGVRDRGSSTAGQAKPNMTFETWGAEGTNEDDDANVGLLGFSSESDWVLHAPFNFDRAMIRNQLAYDLSNQFGRWAPGTRAVEVYLNRGDGVVSGDDYMGVYVLTEKIKQGAGRLDIAQLGPEDNAEPEVSGGYIWKVDRADPDAGTFSAGGQSLNWVYPKSPNSRSASDDQKATEAQEQFVQDYLGGLNQAIRRPDINDPDGYSKFVDVGSWVDHHLISVFQDDVDAFVLSAYVHKNRDGKIEMGPLWDFDRSAESLDDRDDDPFLWGGSGGSNFFGRTWFTSAFRDPGFWQAYVDRWQEVRRTTMSLENLDATVDRLSGEIAEAQARNYEARVNRGVRPRTRSNYSSGKLDGTWEGEVEHLRSWLHDRVSFFDSMFTQPPEFVVNGDTVPLASLETLQDTVGLQVSAGQQVEIAGPKLRLSDDTIVISGEPGVTTGRFLAIADDSLGDEWVQPNFDDAAWQTGPTGWGFESSDNFEGLIQTEIRPAEGGTTVLARIPFNIADASTVQDNDFVLRMKYDDGFVAYLNGTEMRRINLRDDELAWNSRATAHRNSEAAEFEDFDISEFKNLLVDGENVLAIRGINSTTTSNDMLMVPELVSRRFVFQDNPDAKVYYTTDGSDPRGPDGTPSPTATQILTGETIAITENTRLIARNFDDVLDRGSEARIVRTDWSSPVEQHFIVTQPELVISEINYDPAPASDAEITAGFSGEDFEFVELQNVGGTPANLLGIALSDAVEFRFNDSETKTIAPGGYAVIAANQAAFQMRYGNEIAIVGTYEGNLNNGGDELDLVSGTGDLMFSVNYDNSDPWPARASGFGATLEWNATPTDLSDKWYNWRASSENGGSPGSAGRGAAGVVINEILSDDEDRIELRNQSNQAIDISGWYLSDSSNDFFKFEIPDGAVIPPNDVIVFGRTDFGFGLSAINGDDVWLVQRASDGSVASFEDDVHFGPSQSGVSIGRTQNSNGRLVPLDETTLDELNTDPRVGSVVISEVHYNPVIAAADLEIDANLDASDLEFVEILNASPSAVDLSDWQVRGGIDFNFDDGTILASDATIVVLKFDPLDPENVNQLNAFRAHFVIDEQVAIVGGYSGLLNNSFDRIELRRAIESDDGVIRVTEDEVLFDDQLPWPQSADGGGHSLQRIDPLQFGNDGSSFIGAVPTPGSLSSGNSADFNEDGEIDAADIDLLFQQIRAAAPEERFDLTGDSEVDDDDRDFLVNRILGTNYGDSNLDGIFDSRDLVLVFQNAEYEDGIAQNSGWEDGDWDGDGEFGSRDLVLAFQQGAYVSASVSE